MSISVIIPAKNEAPRLKELLPEVRTQLPEAEILVIDDGSTDGTGDVARELGATVFAHPYSIGNGASIKSGIRQASGEILVMMDGDGQHNPRDIPDLLAYLEQGYELVIGARSSNCHASWGRRLANRVFNGFASWMTGHRIPDLTSGFRAVRAARAREFLSLLPNGFSYPTTLTMAMFKVGYPVTFHPIRARQRSGQSHIRPTRDALRFLLIIMRIGALYSPLKLFFPASLVIGATALTYYAFTYFVHGRFTNMGLLLVSVAVLVFLMGLLAEQITTLIYRRGGE